MLAAVPMPGPRGTPGAVGLARERGREGSRQGLLEERKLGRGEEERVAVSPLGTLASAVFGRDKYGRDSATFELALAGQAHSQVPRSLTPTVGAVDPESATE